MVEVAGVLVNILMNMVWMSKLASKAQSNIAQKGSVEGTVQHSSEG